MTDIDIPVAAPLNAREQLLAQHAQRAAVRATAGLARDAQDFRQLCEVLDLDPVMARVELPPAELSPPHFGCSTRLVNADLRPTRRARP